MQGDRAHLRLSLRSLDLLGSDAELRERAEAALRDRDAHRFPVCTPAGTRPAR